MRFCFKFERAEAHLKVLNNTRVGLDAEWIGKEVGSIAASRRVMGGRKGQNSCPVKETGREKDQSSCPVKETGREKGSRRESKRTAASRRVTGREGS